MRVQNALILAQELLSHRDEHRLIAQALLMHVLGVSRGWLIAHDRDLLSADQLARYWQAVARAERGEPLPYLLGRHPFRQLDLHVSPAVLIPRPETELLVELALQWAHKHAPSSVADIGTGSGCIAISLALALPQATVYAVDISADALAIAQQNSAEYHTSIQFLHASLLEPLSSCQLIIANLPYISDEEWTHLDSAVKSYEPSLALRGGAGGVTLFYALLQQATTKLGPNGAIFLEIGWQQGERVTALAKLFFPSAEITLYHDDAGWPRVIAIETTERHED